MADAARKYSDKQLKALEWRLKREYAQAAKEITEKAAKYFAQFAEKDAKKQEELKAGKITQEQYKSWRWGQMMTGKRWTAMKETLANDLTNVRKTAIQMANDTLPEIYAESANYATYTIEKGARVDTSFTLYSKDTVRALAEAKEIPLPKRKVDVAKDKKWNTQKVTSAVLQGVLQGESVDKIAKKLQTVTDMNRRAAARNARTMVTAAENQGRADMYTRAEDMGIQLEQVWIATLDERTRDSHRHLDGERIKTGGKFSNGLRYPGDPNGSAAEIYNCRCTMRAVVEGIDDDLSDLSQRNTNKLQGLSYEEWKNAKATSKHYGESVKDYEARVAAQKAQATAQKATATTKESTSRMAEGKDISKTFVYRSDANVPKSVNDYFNEHYQKEAILQIAEEQGYNKAPTVVSREEFNKLVQEHGNISFRTLDGTTVEEADEYCHQFMYEDNIGYNYGGGRLHGNGLYIAKNSSTEEFLSGAEVAASRDSFGYGQSQMAIVYDKSTKLIEKGKLKEIISGMSDEEKQRYGESGMQYRRKVLTDYAAALGYDGVLNGDSLGLGVEYITIFNRTKLYVCEDINHKDDGIAKW